jgi:hypothetical protein
MPWSAATVQEMVRAASSPRYVSWRRADALQRAGSSWVRAMSARGHSSGRMVALVSVLFFNVWLCKMIRDVAAERGEGDNFGS